MVAFASLIGAAAIYAGVASAGPMMASSSAYWSAPTTTAANSYGSGNYNNHPGDNMSASAPPSMATSMAAPYSAPPAYAPPASPPSVYGSGSSNWNNNGGYNNCVQQCVAQFGSPSSMSMPPSSTSPPAGEAASPAGSGVTHTVIVAPTQGVLRYVPFAVNASVGDTVLFMWGANNHTVTKSSQLEICNKTSDQPFASGEQNKPFTFTQVVNDTNPTFFYCGTPTHCEKGMFGIINPPNAYQQPQSASNMMASLASQYPSTQAAWSYASNLTSNNTVASNWGMNIDMSQMPSWSQPYVAENIMYTMAFIAMNPETVPQNGGNIDFAPLSNSSVMLPSDVAAAARQNNAQSGTPASSVSSSSSSASATPSSAASGGLKSGASALALPRVAVALIAVAAAFFAL